MSTPLFSISESKEEPIVEEMELEEEQEEVEEGSDGEQGEAFEDFDSYWSASSSEEDRDRAVTRQSALSKQSSIVAHRNPTLMRRTKGKNGQPVTVVLNADALEAWVKSVDMDYDDEISVDELWAIVKRKRVSQRFPFTLLEEMVTEADFDKDGSLSPREFANAVLPRWSRKNPDVDLKHHTEDWIELMQVLLGPRNVKLPQFMIEKRAREEKKKMQPLVMHSEDKFRKSKLLGTVRIAGGAPIDSLQDGGSLPTTRFNKTETGINSQLKSPRGKSKEKRQHPELQDQSEEDDLMDLISRMSQNGSSVSGSGYGSINDGKKALSMTFESRKMFTGFQKTQKTQSELRVAASRKSQQLKKVSGKGKSLDLESEEDFAERIKSIKFTGFGKRPKLLDRLAKQRVGQRMDDQEERELKQESQEKPKFQSWFGSESMYDAKMRAAKLRAEQNLGEPWKPVKEVVKFRELEDPVDKPAFVTHFPKKKFKDFEEGQDLRPMEALLDELYAAEKEALKDKPRWDSTFHPQDKDHEMGTGAKIERLPVEPMPEPSSYIRYLENKAAEKLGTGMHKRSFVTHSKTLTPRDSRMFGEV